LEPRIKVTNVSKSFSWNYNLISDLFRRTPRKKLHAVKDVSFEVNEGEILGIVGANGSGKTTLLRIISGIYQPDSGHVSINGRLAPILQLGAGFNGELNAIDNITISAMLMGVSKKEISSKTKQILEFADLKNYEDLKIKYYSSGMKARLSFATAMQIDPDILLLDEILSVGDRGFKKKSYDLFLRFKEEGKTIVFTSHSLEAHLNISNRVLVMDKGKLVFTGEPKEGIEIYKNIIDKRGKK
jgi:ABC-2 type transport system ATP-binding protein